MVVKIGDLNRRIEVLSQRESKDSFGGETGEWITTGRVWAKIAPYQGSENIAEWQLKTKQLSNVTMRFFAGISTDNRIRYMDRVFNILSVADFETEHRWTTVVVEEIASGKL